METTFPYNALLEAKRSLQKGEIEKCGSNLKIAANYISALEDDDQPLLIGEFEDIKETLYRLIALEKIVESYKKDPEKTKNYANLLKKTKKERIKSLFKHLQTTLY